MNRGFWECGHCYFGQRAAERDGKAYDRYCEWCGGSGAGYGHELGLWVGMIMTIAALFFTGECR